MMAVEIQTTPAFHVGKPKFLFERNLSNGYDVTRDGKQFLVVKGQDPRPTTSDQLNVVVNWFEELRRRAPIRR
jgi:hypothetical protein